MSDPRNFILPAYLIPPTIHDRWMPREFEPGLVSVIIPTYNRAVLVGEAIRSVCDQTYRPVEILLVDDGSTDDTAKQADKWQSHCDQQDVRFRFFQQSNHGAPTARNRGMIESRGEFLQFLDSDDLLEDDKFAAQTAALRTAPESFACYGYTQYYDAEEKPTERFGGPSAEPRLMDAVLPNFDCISPLYRRAALIATGPWDESLRCLQNWEHRARFLLQFGPAVFLEQVVCRHRLHDGERISDHGDEAFLAGCLEAVLRMEAIVRAAPADHAAALNYLSRCAFAVFKKLLAAGRRQPALTALRESQRLAVGRRKKLLQFLMLAFQCMPTQLLNRLVQSIANRRLAVQQTG